MARERQSVELMDGGSVRGLWRTPQSNWNAYVADLHWDCPWVSRLLEARATVGMVSSLVSKENILDLPALRRRIWGFRSFPSQTSITAPSLSSVILSCGLPLESPD